MHTYIPTSCIYLQHCIESSHQTYHEGHAHLLLVSSTPLRESPFGWSSHPSTLVCTNRSVVSFDPLRSMSRAFWPDQRMSRVEIRLVLRLFLSLAGARYESRHSKSYSQDSKPRFTLRETRTTPYQPRTIGSYLQCGNLPILGRHLSTVEWKERR